MNYTEFIDTIKSEVETLLTPGIIVELHTAIKNNGTIRRGLILEQKGINISPAIYLEEFYEKYQTGQSPEELAKTICHIYKKVKFQKSCSYNELFSFEKIKANIVYKLIQRKTNEKLLTEVPYEPFLDMALVFYVILDVTPTGNATILIRNEHVKGWNIRKEELACIAKENTPSVLPLEFQKMTEYMLIITNKFRNMGACAICYPGACEKAYRILGDNFYAIPSSIHEMILVPESYGIQRKELELMTRNINEIEVAEEEVLGERVYYYTKEGGLKVVE